VWLPESVPARADALCRAPPDRDVRPCAPAWSAQMLELADDAPATAPDRRRGMDTVAQIMSTDVHTARPSEVIGPLRELMLREHIGCIPIVDDDGALRGLVTSHDLVEEWPPMMGVATVMSTDVVTVPPHRSVVEAARTMVAERRHHLVVTERDVVVGVVSSYDVMMLLAGRVEQTHLPAPAEGHTPAGLRASVGDLVVVRGGHIGERDRRAVIEEVRGEAGGPPFVVRWLGGGDERRHLYFPGSDATIEHASA
jgi:CBS domain-containing protein